MLDCTSLYIKLIRFTGKLDDNILKRMLYQNTTSSSVESILYNNAETNQNLGPPANRGTHSKSKLTFFIFLIKGFFLLPVFFCSEAPQNKMMNKRVGNLPIMPEKGILGAGRDKKKKSSVCSIDSKVFA